MSKELMAECLTEAVGLVILKPKSQATAGWMLCVCTIAVALYQERCRQAGEKVGEGELVTEYDAPRTPDGVWRHVPSGVQTAKPMVCPDCSQVWTERHVCPAAGSRGTARWPAS